MKESGTNAGNNIELGSSAMTSSGSKKRMISMRVEVGVIDKMKARAAHVGIPYQTLAASVLKRFVEGKLDIELT